MLDSKSEQVETIIIIADSFSNYAASGPVKIVKNINESIINNETGRRLLNNKRESNYNSNNKPDAQCSNPWILKIIIIFT